MAVHAVRGDLFDSEAQTIVNTVNCVGIMGKGLAEQFKSRFPDMYRDYVRRCERGEVRLGRPYLYTQLWGKWVLNFPTKDHWRSVARLSDIVAGLEYLVGHYREWGIQSLAVPPLGCGLGQLDWTVVGPTLHKHLSRMDIPVYLHAPAGTPDWQLETEFLTQEANAIEEFSTSANRIQPAWIALIEVLARLADEPHSPPVGRVTFQKLAYASQVAGLPLGVEFKRGSYGPYSPAIQTMLGRLVNNGLVEECKLGRMLRVLPGSTFLDARKTYESELDEWEPQLRRVQDLFMRLDTKRAEVVASVMFASQDIGCRSADRPTEDEVIRYVLQWKRKDSDFDEQTVESAIHGLAGLGWIRVDPGARHTFESMA